MALLLALVACTAEYTIEDPEGYTGPDEADVEDTAVEEDFSAFDGATLVDKGNAANTTLNAGVVVGAVGVGLGAVAGAMAVFTDWDGISSKAGDE